MKKTLFSFVMIALSMTACDFTPKFTVNGTIKGKQTGNAYLVTEGKEQMDTLAKAVILDSVFTLTGSVNTLTAAYLIIEGERGGNPIFIENTDFTATLNAENPTENKIEGSTTQDLANRFFAIDKESRIAQAKLSQDFREATQAEDTTKVNNIRREFNDIIKDVTAKKDSLTKANPDSFVIAYMLESRMSGLKLEKLTAEYNALGAIAKASPSGKKIEKRIEQLLAVEIGQVAPDFTLNTPEGKPLSMHSIKAKVKVLDFWASWCGPCRSENPNVVKMYNEFHKEGLEILGVSLDNKQEAWVKAIKDDHLTWPQVSDLKGWNSTAAKLYAINGIPHIVVLDENNVIVAKNLRGDALKAKIAEMLK